MTYRIEISDAAEAEAEAAFLWIARSLRSELPPPAVARRQAREAVAAD